MNPDSVRLFYRAAAVGLRALDQRGVRRRFGREADERWKQLRGDMTAADRFELLLKDASVAFPLAFAPRDVFAIPGLLREDPFGAAWAGPPQGLATSLLREEADVPADPVAAFDLAARTWEVSPKPFDVTALPRIGPPTQVVAAGLGALRALVLHFAAHRSGLDLAEQVLFVADAPAERHLFGIAALLLGATREPRVVSSRVAVERVRAMGVTRVDARVTSDDASEPARDTVLGLADALAG